MVQLYQLPNPELLNQWLKMSHNFTSREAHLACFDRFCELGPTKTAIAEAAKAEREQVQRERVRGRGMGRGRGSRR